MPNTLFGGASVNSTRGYIYKIGYFGKIVKFLLHDLPFCTPPAPLIRADKKELKTCFLTLLMVGGIWRYSTEFGCQANSVADAIYSGLLRLTALGVLGVRHCAMLTG